MRIDAGLAGRARGIVVATCLAGALPSPARADEIDRFMRQEREVYGIPALLVGVIRDGRLVDARAAGQADVERSVPARTTQVFEIGSISKQFTAYAVLMLMEQGRLALDQPVGRYLDDLPADWARVTLHQLLTHTSGLPDLEAAFTYGIYRETPGDADFQRRIAALPRDFEPGAQWRYSNTNYWLLARVIEKVSGERYADHMRRAIFEPLGMRSTRSALPDEPLPGRVAGYQRVHGVLRNRDAIRPETGRGLGDIATTLADMARWEREQLSPRLVRAGTAALARQPVVLNDGSTHPYGYGWLIDKTMGVDTLRHDGQTAGFTAAYIRVPSRRLAVVAFANVFDSDIDAVGEVALGQVDPSLRRPRLSPIADEQPERTRRLAEVLDTGRDAAGAWREDWFTPPTWTRLKPWLGELADRFANFGARRSLVLVDRDRHAAGTVLTYRVVYPKLSRLVSVTFDDEGRIARFRGTDE